MAGEVVVRPLREGELDEAASLGTAPAAFRDHYARLCALDETRPEWAFVAERGGRIVGRVVYWSLPRVREVVHPFGLQVPWDTPDWMETGVTLLRESLGRMRAHGAERVQATVYAFVDRARERRRVLAAAGVVEVQEKQRFVHHLDVPLPLPAAGLAFRPRTQTGDPAFVDAVRRVTEGTLDRLDAEDGARDGPAAAAQAYFDVLRDLHDDPDLWRLAHDPQGELVGLVVPQLLSAATGVVNYVGVVPRHRGRRHCDALVAEALRLLAVEHVESVVAETDVLNHPLAASLLRLGFRPEGPLHVHRVGLQQ